MNKLFTNTYPIINLYKKRSLNSEVVTQMIYGDSFKIINKKNRWFRIKILEDNYKGFIKEKKFFKFIKPSHKVFNLFYSQHLKKIILKITVLNVPVYVMMYYGLEIN